MKKKLARQDYGVTEATLAFLVVFLIVLSFVSFSNFNQQGIFDRKGFIDFLTGRQPPFTSPVDQIGLIAHWEFNEGAGTLVADSSSSGYDGAAVNIGWESSNCYEGACGSFSGVNGQVEIPSFNVAGNEISIAAWINPNSFAIGDARILSKAVGTSGNDHTFMLSTQNSGGTKLRFRLQTGGSTETHICTDQDLVTGTWQHVAAVYDGSSVVVYVNGIACILDSGGVQSGSITSADAPVWIGNNPPGTPDKTFDGFIDEIVIYDRGLTFAEIAVLADLVCGNGLLDAGETCDPPEAICSPEYGGSCDYCGNSCNYETVQGGFCGDLNVDSPDEVCDGGSQNCDAGAGAYGTQSCSNDCSAFNSCVATGGFCGDGTTDSGFGETCDDGNNLDGDGCDTLCQFESLSSGGGWTTFTPSVDTEIVYISDSLGNDAACEAYLASEISDPFNPTTSVIPCKTISQAKGIYDLLPDNEPHWLLFKAGDTWNGQSLGTWSKSGRSKTEPAVVASYDTTTINRPTINTGQGSFSGAMTSSGSSYIVFSDLYIKSNYVSPAGMQSNDGPRAFRWIPSSPSSDWTFEGLQVEGYGTAFLIGHAQNPGVISNVIFRNNVIAKNQGENAIYITGVYGLKLYEGNVFYDNGYFDGHTDSHYRSKHIYHQQENGYPAHGDPTGNTIFRDNLFVDSASYSFHARTGGDITNNYIEDTGYGIVVGRHDGIDEGGPFLPRVTSTIKNNVLLHSTDSGHQPLASGMVIENAEVTIEKNIIAYYNSAFDYGAPFIFHEDMYHANFPLNPYYQNEGSHTIGEISQNTIYEIFGDINYGSGPGLFTDENQLTKTNNLINDEMDLLPTNLRSSTVNFVDPVLRDMAKYNFEVLGGANDRDAFMSEATKQWRNYYRSEYTVPVLNDWVREGFRPDGSQPDVCGKGAVECSVCGDGVCEGSEDGASCTADCAFACVGGKPGAHNTGHVSAYEDLIPYVGPSTITIDGTVLDGYLFSGQINIEADNVVIRDFYMDANNASYGFNIRSGTSNTLIEDGIIEAIWSASILGSDATIRRLEVFNSGGDGFKLHSNILLESSWVHHPVGLKGNSHADAEQMRAGANSVFKCNNFDIPIEPAEFPNAKSNACFIMQSSVGAIDNLVMDSNWCNGGNYAVTVENDENYLQHGCPTNVELTNNRFGRDYRHGLLSSGCSIGTLDLYTCGNMWEDTGALLTSGDGFGQDDLLCSPGVACTVDADCDDTLFCTGIETCENNICQTNPLNLGDGISCTDDSCDEGTGVTHIANNDNCDDGLFCNGIETCDAISDCQVTPSCSAGETCDEGTDQCVAATSCSLDTATWDITSAIEGTAVGFEITGTDCEGEELSIEVFEDDGVLGSDAANSNPANIFFAAGNASGTWIAEWQCDEDVLGVCTFGNPEYYFVATLVSDPSASITSSTALVDELVTTASTAVCGNGLTEAGETCDDGNTADGDGCDSSCQTESSDTGSGSESGGGGSGGGGGGSGEEDSSGGDLGFSNPQVYQLSSEDLSTGTSLPLFELDSVFFSIDLGDYLFTVGGVEETFVVLTIIGDQEVVTINLGEEEQIDLDGDGDSDLSLLLNFVTDNSADILFMEISENVVEETSGDVGFESGESKNIGLIKWVIYGGGLLIFSMVLWVVIHFYLKKKSGIRRRRVLRR